MLRKILFVPNYFSESVNQNFLPLLSAIFPNIIAPMAKPNMYIDFSKVRIQSRSQTVSNSVATVLNIPDLWTPHQYPCPISAAVTLSKTPFLKEDQGWTSGSTGKNRSFSTGTTQKIPGWTGKNRNRSFLTKTVREIPGSTRVFYKNLTSTK